jgi:hypothetical protein
MSLILLTLGSGNLFKKGCRMIIFCRTYNLILKKRLNPWTNDLPSIQAPQ